MKNDYYIQDTYCNLEEVAYICKRLEEDIKLCDIEDHPAGDGILKTATTQLAFWGHAREYLGRFEETIHHANHKYFGLDLYKMTGFECVNYNKYSETDSGEYGWHSDGHNEEIFDLKLTAIINISTEPYEGGKLELFLGGAQHVERFDAPGSCIIFPSFTQHRVTPVTKGTRKTLSLWMRGPLFR
jgi:PKHD-type hydroxylase